MTPKNTHSQFYMRLTTLVSRLQNKYPNRPYKALTSLMFWCIKYSLTASYITFKNVLSGWVETKHIRETPNILFDLCGGVGDFVVASTYLKELYKFIGGACQFSVCANMPQQVVESIFRGHPWIDKICDPHEMDNPKYMDTAISLFRFPNITYRAQKSKKYNSIASDLLDYYENFNRTHVSFCNQHTVLFGIMYSQINGYTRYNQLDIGHKLGMSNETRPIMLLEENAFDVLKRTDLDHQTYVTVQRSTGISGRATFDSTRLWSVPYYNILIQRIHTEYPSFSIVQVGKAGTQSDLVGVDIDLRGKTSFEELKIILKQSALHIDAECGMVHLTHTLGGRSAVLFGPTSVDFLGYPENINVKAKDACPLSCEFLTNNWHDQCVRGFDTPPCMEQLTPELFFDAIKEHLHAVTNEKPCTLNEIKESQNPVGTILFIGDFPDEAMLKWVQPNNRVWQFSMNLTPESIRRKAAAQITADYSDILNIPMKKASCDAVFCSYAEPLSPHALRELTRILKIGGTLQTQDGRFYVKEHVE